MAITFIGQSTTDQVGAQSLTFDLSDIGPVADDLMIAFVKQSENTGQQTWDDDGGGGNGWTRLAYNRTTGGRDQETAIYYKIHSGSESNPTFTWDSGGTNEPMSGALHVYRGTDLTNPIQDWGFIEAQNDANPPNAGVNITNDPATIICFHAATHDDITAVSPPTGFTQRSTVWSGTANDHRNLFVANLIGRSGTGSYTPPDWQHTVANTTPEYHCYTIALQEPVLISVTDVNIDEKIAVDETNNLATGFGFESTQGTGKIELWSDTSGTTKVQQTVVSWTDIEITFDAVDTGLDEGTLYIVVTNDNGDESAPLAVTYGLPSYSSFLKALEPDHLWPLDNSFDDEGITGPTRNMTSGVVGTHTFSTNTICEDTTHTWEMDGVTKRREIADSPNMNITINSKERTVMFWTQLNGIQKSLSALWKEGGGVQNLAFLVGLGNVLMWQLADVAGTRDNVQAVCGIRLTAGRPYHACGIYSHLDATKQSRVYLDGRIQPLELTDGNDMTLGIFDSHSGDVVWNDPDNSLETGGTDILYVGQEDSNMNYFATWSDNSNNTSAGRLTDAEILDCFRRGAPPDDIIAADTEANMQTALDATADARPDWPLSYRIMAPSSGGPNLTLTMTDKVFDARVSDHLEWRGSGTLTIIAEGTTNIDEVNRVFAPNGGSVVVQRPGQLTLTGLKNPTEVRVFEAGTTTEVTGQENVTSGTFSATIGVSSVDIMIVALGYIVTRLEGVDTSSNISLPINQRIDRQYGND